MGAKDGVPPVFRSKKYNDTLVDWLQAGATSKERERTMTVLQSTLKFKPQTRPRTSGGSSAGAGRLGGPPGRHAASARARPNSTGTDLTGLEGLLPGAGDGAAAPSPHKTAPNKETQPRPSSRGGLPPKPRSPTSVLDAEAAMEARRPGSSAGRQRQPSPAAEMTAVPAVMVKGQVYSVRPETPKVQTVDQRHSLRPGTPQRGQPGKPPIGPFRTDSPAAGSAVRAARSARAAGGTSSSPPSDAPSRSLDLTSHSVAYGIREAAPDIYDEMLDITKPSQAENANFASQCDFSDGFPMFMRKTAYEEANERLATTIQDNGAAQAQSFHNWIKRQRTYFGDLLTPEAAARVDAWFETATDEEKEEFIVAFRNIHATADPDRHKSLSHVHYRLMKNPLDDDDLALINDENRFATYGRPKDRSLRDVSIKVPKERPQTPQMTRPGTAPVGSSAGGRGAKRMSREDMDLKKELYTSNVPLKWACTTVGPLQSAYQANHGANMRDLMKSISDTMEQRENMMTPLGLGPTLGFGKVDPVLYQHRAAAFPVPDCYLHGTLANAESRDENKYTTYMSTHGQALDKPWALLDPQEKLTAAKVAAIEAMRLQEFRERLKRTRVPLGSSAIFNQVNPKTMNQTQLTRYPERAYHTDPSAARLLSVYTGPTASVSACAPAENPYLPTRHSLAKGSGSGSRANSTIGRVQDI